MALRAVVLGDNCIDRYLPPVDRDFVGGQAVNVAAHLAGLGVTTTYAGVVGEDPAGDRILRELAERGVDVSAVERTAGRTGLTVIATKDGERRFVSEEYGVSAPYVPTPRALLLARGARLVYAVHLLDMWRFAASLPSGVELAVDWSEEDVADLPLPRIDVLFISRPGLPAEEAQQEARRIARYGARTVVITLGRAGAVAATSASVDRVPAVATRVVDTLGAGDAFAAAFLARRLAGADLRPALEAGSRAAATACGHLGALPSLRPLPA